jgi:N-acetylneuraminic acid mutarotase
MSCLEVTAPQKKKNIYKHTKIGRSNAMELSHIMRNTKFDLTRKNVKCSFNNGDLKIYLIGGLLIGPTITNAFYKYENSNWYASTTLPTNLHRHSSVVYNGYIYILGGLTTLSSGSVTSHSYKYENNTWNLQGNMNSTRRDFGCCVFDNKIYVFGGYNTLNLNSIEYYDGTLWNTSSVTLPTLTSRTVAVLYNGLVYIVGGINGTGRTNSVYIFNGTTVTIGPTMPESVELHTVVVFNNELYVIGGINGPYPYGKKVFKYDGVSWSYVNDLNIARYGHSALVYGNAIYVFGGNTGTTTTNTIEKYDGINWVIEQSFQLPYETMFHTTN